MIYVTKAEYRNDFKIWVEFSDGVSGIADLEDVLWGPVFEPLREKINFQQFKVSDLFQTITWYNGADIAPEALYAKVISSRGDAL
jgi:hypothetical protein